MVGRVDFAQADLGEEHGAAAPDVSFGDEGVAFVSVCDDHEERGEFRQDPAQRFEGGSALGLAGFPDRWGGRSL